MKYQLETHVVANVPIFAVGEHNGDNYTSKDLDYMVEAFYKLQGKIDPPLKLGHTTPEFNQMLASKLNVPVEVVDGDKGKGTISMGWVKNLRRNGDLLIADLTNVPTVIRDLILSKSYMKVSSEIWWDYEDADRVRYPRVLTGLALLGSELQAVPEATLVGVSVYSNISSNIKTYDISAQELKSDLDIIEASAAGTKGAHLWTKIFGSIRKNLEDVLNKKEAEASPVESEEEDMDGMAKEILSMLGLPETATMEEIMAAMKALMQGNEMANKVKGELALGETATIDQIVAAIAGLKERLNSVKDLSVKEFTDTKAQLDSKISELANKDTELVAKGKEIAELKKAAKLSEFTDKAKGLTHIAGTPEAIAKDLMKMYEFSPELAESQLNTYVEWDKAAEKAGMFANIGVNGKGIVPDEKHVFLTKVEDRMKEKKISEADASTQIANEYPDIWRDYRKQTRTVTKAEEE